MNEKLIQCGKEKLLERKAVDFDRLFVFFDENQGNNKANSKQIECAAQICFECFKKNSYLRLIFCSSLTSATDSSSTIIEMDSTKNKTTPIKIKKKDQNNSKLFSSRCFNLINQSVEK
jgi:hypothetical protein